MIYFFAAFLVAGLDDSLVTFSSIPVAFLPASAAPTTAPSAAPLAAPTNTAFNAFFALSKSRVREGFFPDFPVAPFLAVLFFRDFWEAGFFARAGDAELLDFFLVVFLVGMVLPLLEDFST